MHAPGEHGSEMISGCPTPWGPACEWALHNLVDIVDAAFPADLPTLAVKRVRMMVLAHHLQETMGDLCRNDWQSQAGADCARAVQLPERLSRLAIFYVRAFDVVGTSAYSGYYQHDVINHPGHLYQYVRKRGFTSLCELSNSFLEHHHQDIGKPCFWNAFISSKACMWRVINILRKTKDTPLMPEGELRDPSSEEAAIGWQDMLMQLGWHFGPHLCDRCHFFRHRCHPLGCVGKGPHRRLLGLHFLPLLQQPSKLTVMRVWWQLC